MFTGLITDVGVWAEYSSLETGIRARIHTRLADGHLEMGESIAVDGCCLTVVKQDRGWFDVEVSHESLARTNLADKKLGAKVNLERAMRLGDRLGGHWVQGHVDGVGTLAEIRPLGESHEIEIEVPPELSKYIVEKGSLTVSGVSLTVNRIVDSRVSINLIRHTWENTSLGTTGAGGKVNLEVDILAKHAEKLLAAYRR